MYGLIPRIMDQLLSYTMGGWKVWMVWILYLRILGKCNRMLNRFTNRTEVDRLWMFGWDR